MKLKAVAVRDFAGLRHTELDFDERLTVVVGDNEAGKSTLLTALRAAFFHRHRANTEAVRAFAPYGRQARPEISVRFELAGVDYALEKSFLQKAEARLEWAGGRLVGDAVDDKLAELLRFTHGPRDSKLDQNQGAFGLLWVEQGRAPQGLDLGVGKDALTASLEGEIGQILGGERGRALLASAKAMQDRYFTDSGRVKGSSPLKAAEDALSEHRAALSERREAQLSYEERLDRLANRRRRLAAHGGQEVRRAAEAKLAAAEKRARETEALQGRLGEAIRLEAAAEAAFAQAGERLGRRRDLASAATSLAERQTAARRTLQDLADRAAPLAEATQAAVDGLAAARDAEARAEADVEAERRAEEKERGAQEHRELKARLDEAAALRERLEALRTGERSPVDRTLLKALADAGRDRLEASIRLQATATILAFDLDEGREGRRADGTPLRSGEDVVVGTEESFELAGFGRIRVRPAGGSADLAARLTEAEAAERRLLQKAGAASLALAEAAFAAQEEKERERILLADRIRQLLPDGEPTALDRLVELEKALGVAAATPAPDPHGASALERLRLARTAREAAGAVLERARAAEGAIASEIARAESALHYAREAADANALAVERADGQRPPAALESDLSAAAVEREAARLHAVLARAALQDADPEAVRLEADRARDALAGLDRAVADLLRETATLEGELAVQGVSSINEEIDRLTGEIETLEREVARLSLDAAASSLLFSTLRDAQRSAREHWLGPIRSGVAPYLRLIQPGGDLDFDESTLEIRSLTRAGHDEAFARLSTGAREQIAVATRLALAGVLHQAGHPAAVILDDALVNTDEERLGRMHLVLRKAAETLQIIVLTCRERDFRDLGAPLVRL